ncbi:hypothetical protein DL98DRAFT_583325 [Cadophora sp. DSE1049]|nr:hypothetical protein DL98DRAFT_583325 [Cadophora sp. DSE1049]
MMTVPWSASEYALRDFGNNVFGAKTSFSKIDMLVLAGSPFNHSDTPNLEESWDDTTEKMCFTTLRDIKAGFYGIS